MTQVVGERLEMLYLNRSFAAERSRGSPNWWADGALGHVKQRKFKFGGFV